MSRAPLAVIIGALFGAVVAAQSSAPRPSASPGQRFIRETDLLRFSWVADPQISPDGSMVALVRVTVDEREDRYDTSVFLVPTSQTRSRTGEVAPRRLTSGTRDTSPRWSPDGRQIAFLRSTERDGRGQPPQLYVLRMDGGEARQVTDLPNGVSAPSWSPDGRTIAFTSTNPALRDRDSGDRSKAEERTSDVRVITRAVYRENGNPGYVDHDHPSHLWTVAVPAAPTDRPIVRQVTEGPYDEHGLTWATDSSSIYFISTRVPEPYYEPEDSDLYRVPASGGALQIRSAR